MKQGEGIAERGFKLKTIEKIIKGKVRHWIDSIKPENDTEKAKLENNKFKAEISDSYIVTGGAIASMFQGYEANDFDIYFNNVETAAKVAEHYIKQLKTTSKVSSIEVRKDEKTNRVKIYIKSAGIASSEDQSYENYDYFEMLSVKAMKDYFESLEIKKEDSKEYKVININTNAITLTNDVQLVLRFIGPAEEIHKNYDFIHCTNYYTEKTGVVVNNESLISVLSKELKYVGSLYPICSMFRIKKFIARNWTITAGEMLKIAWDINNLNLKDMNVLQDQLVGVDAAYFHQMLEELKKFTNDPINAGKEIDRTYLFEVINRVFDGDNNEE